MKFGGVDFSLPQTEYEAHRNAETCIHSLRETLDTRQRKLLLQIIDHKDSLCEQYGEDMFAQGFRTCARLMLACFTPCLGEAER